MVTLAASELTSSYYGRAKVLIELKKLRRVGIAFAFMFFFIVGITIASLISA